MQKTNLVLLIIGILILIGLAFYLGLVLGQKQMQISLLNSISPLPQSALIKDWRTAVSGEVTELTSQSITISSEGKTLSVPLSDKTVVKKFVVEDGKITETSNLTLQDIKQGDVTAIGIIADPQGNLWVESVNLREIR